MPNTHGPSPMETTPKPRAGKHVRTPETDAAQEAAYKSHEGRGGWVTLGHDSRAFDIARKLEAERDLLRERERELVEALTELAGDIEGIYDYCKRRDLMVVSIGQFRRLNAARALLAKHGR